MRTRAQTNVIEHSKNLASDAARQLDRLLDNKLAGRELATVLDRIARQLGDASMLLKNVTIEGFE